MSLCEFIMNILPNKLTKSITFCNYAYFIDHYSILFTYPIIWQSDNYGTPLALINI
jgi:hypothetical protein